MADTSTCPPGSSAGSVPLSLSSIMVPSAGLQLLSGRLAHLIAAGPQLPQASVGAHRGCKPCGRSCTAARACSGGTCARRGLWGRVCLMGVLLGGRFRFFWGPLWGDTPLSLIRRRRVTRMRHFLLLPVAVVPLPCGVFAPTSRASVDSACPLVGGSSLRAFERTLRAVLISVLTASADDHLLAAQHA